MRTTNTPRSTLPEHNYRTMLVFELTEDNRWLRLAECNDILEFRQIQIFFTRRVRNWWIYKKKGWDTDTKFFIKDKFLPAGLWGELVRMGKEHNIGVEIRGLERLFHDISPEDFKRWVDEFFVGSDRQPREYQIDAAYKIIRYGISTQELATNAGKTLIVFMVLAYTIPRGMAKKFVMVVPNGNLVIQAAEDFYEYEKHRKEKIGIVTQMIYSGAEQPREEANVVVGTFQSLVKRDQTFLGRFDAIFVDEAHHTNCTSIKKIVANCTNVKWKFGLSGTLGDKESADFFTIQAYLGPLVKIVSADYLQQNDFATKVSVRVIRMSYLPDDQRIALAKLRKNAGDDHVKVYNLERKLVVDNRIRLNFVCDFIARSSKNSLVLFQSVQDGYGKQIYDKLRQLTSDKEIFYVDGDVSTNLREEYKQRLEEGENKILIASFKTFSTGISINNIHNIFFVESYKSEKIIKQSIGRGMRKHDDKEQVNIIDFVDDFSWKGKPNYQMKHSTERVEIYKRERFEYKIYVVDLSAKPVF